MPRRVIRSFTVRRAPGVREAGVIGVGSAPERASGSGIKRLELLGKRLLPGLALVGRANLDNESGRLGMSEAFHTLIQTLQ